MMMMILTVLMLVILIINNNVNNIRGKCSAELSVKKLQRASPWGFVNVSQTFVCVCVCVRVCVCCVLGEPDSGVGTIYVSDDRGTVFSKSLERHLYTTTGSDTDFTVITSLRGVYMTSALTEGESPHCIPFNDIFKSNVWLFFSQLFLKSHPEPCENSRTLSMPCSDAHLFPETTMFADSSFS